MKKQTIIILALLLFSGVTNAEEKAVISRWLIAGPVEAKYPAFHQTENVNGKTFKASDLLSMEHLDLKDYFPEAGMAFQWPQNQDMEWEPAYSDENGFIYFPEGASPESPGIIYLASYIKADRWMKTSLEVKSPYMVKAWVNGKLIGTKATVEKEENSIGKFNIDLELTRGTHLLIIKALFTQESSLERKLMANLEIKEPFSPSDISFSLSPDYIKNINHVLDGVKITGIEPSADGKYYLISYSQSQPPSDKTERWSEVKSFSDNSTIQSFRQAKVSQLNWLPKTNAISYLSSSNGKSAVFLHNIETGQLRILAEGLENITQLQWSPDESYFIYSVREEPGKENENVRHLQGMRDRQPGYRNRSFLYKYDMASEIKTRLTYGSMSTTLYDISPDATTLLIGQNYPDYTQRPYSKSNMFLLDVNTLEVDTLFIDQPWGFSASFSPDGSRLLATGGPSAFDNAGENLPDDKIANNYDRQAYIYDLKSKTVKPFTIDFDPAVSSATWHPFDNNIYLNVIDQDYQRIYKYEPSKDRFTLIDTGHEFISDMELSANAPVLTFRANMANAPSAFYSLNLRNQKVKLLEDTEKQNYRHVRFGEVNDWNFTASSGVEIKGRYYLPPDFDPEAKYPVIVYYYGGTNPVGRTFGGRYPFNLWAGHGYVVYVLQPSGATGFGQEFSAAHVNNWGITVADEIIEGTDKFLKEHPFTDDTKVGCAGASYGGFMTMLLMTRTDMFAAAISHAGISSISSYWGEGFWGYSYSAEATAESFPWNSPEIYVDQSPLFNADKVSTPLLLVTGDSDTNVPPGESIQMYTALKILDKPVELVMVKGEDHHILTYSRRIEWHNTIMAWWAKYLKDQPQWWEDMFPVTNY